MCHIPCHYVRYYVFISLHSGGYGWQYFRCYLYLCHRIHIMYPYRSITFTSWVCMSHLPQLIILDFGAAMWGHLIHTAIVCTSHFSCVHHLARCPENSSCLYYHLWWYVFYGMVRLKAVSPESLCSCLTNSLTEPKGIGENPLPVFTTSSGLFSVAICQGLGLFYMFFSAFFEKS